MDFEKYKQESPEKYKKAYAWKTAIGLQKVDNLTPSVYLYEIVRKNIDICCSFNKYQVLRRFPGRKENFKKRIMKKI
jgi:hypothetical protein